VVVFIARTLWFGQYFHPLVDLDADIAAENKNKEIKSVFNGGYWSF